MDGWTPLSSSQVCLLDVPIIKWDTGAAAKVADLPAIDGLIHHIINKLLVKKLVQPNRITVPVELPEKAKSQLRDLVRLNGEKNN